MSAPEPNAPRPVRGRVLEVAAADPEDREWIFQSLAAAEIYEPFGCRAPPERTLFDADVLELMRGGDLQHEPVRFHILRGREDGRRVGFFVDFGWDFPQDSTREIDLAFPQATDHSTTRNIGHYLDATIIIAQYLFINGLAKRIRWRVETRPGQVPHRSARQGARLIEQVEEDHPVTGSPIVRCVFEYAMADFVRLAKETGLDLFTVDYGDTDMSIWTVYRKMSDR